MARKETRFRYGIRDTEKNIHSTIIKDIAEIEFPKLVCLNLANNHIKSIEELHRMAVPTLENLDLCTHTSMQPKITSAALEQ